jgi:hypothetical protein
VRNTAGDRKSTRERERERGKSGRERERDRRDRNDSKKSLLQGEEKS